jgi:hypothetical protein
MGSPLSPALLPDAFEELRPAEYSIRYRPRRKEWYRDEAAGRRRWRSSRLRGRHCGGRGIGWRHASFHLCRRYSGWSLSIPETGRSGVLSGPGGASMAPSKVRKKVASSKQFIATRDRRDTRILRRDRNDQVGSKFTKQLGTRRRRAQKTPLVPRSKRGFILRMGGPRLGWRCLVQRNAGTARPSAYSGQSRHLVRECEIFSLMWHAPGRGSQSKQRNGGRRTDP